MTGIFYDKLPKDLSRAVNKYYPHGGRPRIAPEISGHNPNYREDRNKLICQRRNEGLSIREIGEQFNLTKRYIKKILKDNGIQDMPEKKKNRKDQIEELISFGYSKKAIAKKLGISRTRLYQIMEEEGL